MISNISVEETKEKKDQGPDFILLDVRRLDELHIASIEGATHIPLQELEKRLGELDKDKELIVFCHHGGRSRRAAQFLLEKGFNVKNMEGGIDAWSKKIDSSISRY